MLTEPLGEGKLERWVQGALGVDAGGPQGDAVGEGEQLAVETRIGGVSVI